MYRGNSARAAVSFDASQRHQSQYHGGAESSSFDAPQRRQPRYQESNPTFVAPPRHQPQYQSSQQHTNQDASPEKKLSFGNKPLINLEERPSNFGHRRGNQGNGFSGQQRQDNRFEQRQDSRFGQRQDNGFGGHSNKEFGQRLQPRFNYAQMSGSRDANPRDTNWSQAPKSQPVAQHGQSSRNFVEPPASYGSIPMPKVEPFGRSKKPGFGEVKKPSQFFPSSPSNVDAFSFAEQDKPLVESGGLKPEAVKEEKSSEVSLAEMITGVLASGRELHFDINTKATGFSVVYPEEGRASFVFNPLERQGEEVRRN